MFGIAIVGVTLWVEGVILSVLVSPIWAILAIIGLGLCMFSAWYWPHNLS